MSDDDNVTPLWKRNFANRGSASAAAGAKTRLTLKTIEGAMYDALDDYGAKAFFAGMLNGSAEDRRAFGTWLVRRMPQQVEMDATLTVKVVTQLGEKVIELDGGSIAHLKMPPKDVESGKRLPVAPSASDAPAVASDPVDG